uniref:Uncharacterized protein n=1 Tax=Caenorhabditis japonica TaxID=281687 RepID=A0A8R1DJA5_CAEJA
MSTSVYVQSKPVSIPAKCVDPMQMSMFSDMMDGSVFSNGSWSDIADSMITSNCTFTVRKGPPMPLDDDSDLMSVQMVKSVFNIDREALRREEQLQSSMVIGESRIGVEHLPIIEDENELETPLVETRTLPAPNDVNANKAPISINPFIEPPLPAVQTPKVENGNSVTSSPTQPSTSSSSSPSSASSIVTSPERRKEREKEPEVEKEVEKEKEPIMVEEVKVIKKKEKEEVAAPVAPKFPVKPKAPSKHQLMMEQLKASIEAEKTKPKKEVKSRVSLLPPPAPKVQKENKDGESTESTPRRTLSKTPLKTVNVKAKTSPAPPIERPKKERKPLYVAPPPKERVEKEKKAPPKPVVSPPSAAAAIPSTSSSRGSFPTSSFAGGRPTTSNRKASTTSSITSSSKPPAAKTIDVKEKLRLAEKSIEVMSIVVSRMSEHDERKLREISEQYEKKTGELGDLKKMLDEARKKFEEDVEQMKSTNQQGGWRELSYST